MKSNFTWHEDKRQATLANRGLDFADAAQVFAGAVFEFEDTRKNYDECRMTTFGMLHDRIVVVVWTPRGAVRRIISMRYAHERETEKYTRRLG